jgi:hypothetical protein
MDSPHRANVLEIRAFAQELVAVWAGATVALASVFRAPPFSLTELHAVLGRLTNEAAACRWKGFKLMKTRHLLPVALLALTPLTGALAQGTGPNAKADNTKEITANKEGSSDTMKPGATGKTVVPGSNSTVAGDSNSTANAKTVGGTAGGSK